MKNAGTGVPSGVWRSSKNRPFARPVRSTVFRNCLGMIMSVSTLIIGSGAATAVSVVNLRSEEHTSELQSLMRISYAVFCLKKKNKQRKELTQYIVISQYYSNS